MAIRPADTSIPGPVWGRNPMIESPRKLLPIYQTQIMEGPLVHYQLVSLVGRIF